MVKNAILAGLFLSALSVRAPAQSEAGTIVVLNSSESEIVVAADSRSHDAKDVVDNRCKITALNGEVVFAASGKTGYGPLRGGTLNWDAHRIARDEFRSLPFTGQKRRLLAELVASWGNKVKGKLQSDLVKNRSETLAGVEGDTLTSALFATLDSQGVYIVTARISYRFTPDGQPRTAFTITNTFDRPMAVFIGDTEIADEFKAADTLRSIQWRREADAEARTAKDRLAFFAIRIVDLSIRYHPGKMVEGKVMATIGGPVDALRLVRGSGVEWIQRKQNCPED